MRTLVRAGFVGLVLLGSLAGGAPRVAAQTPRVLPVDEAAKDPAFFAFRARLQRALAERDTARLLAVVHPEIKLSFGGDFGIESFRESWLADPASDIWGELGIVLALGGRFDGDSTFVAPYTFTDSPDGVDPFEALIALGDAVPVRAAPDADGEVLARLSFEVVRRDREHDGPLPEGWTAVRLADGTPGYARSRCIRSPIDYRAAFSRREGRWSMTVFIAGD